MIFMDPLFLVFALPGLLLSLVASLYTKSTFAKYSRVESTQGMTGAQAAEQMLRRNGVRDVKIERTRGMLTDHYDPSSQTLRLSEAVYSSSSLAAMGVACHEAGHALQHAGGYAMLGLRTALVPAAGFGSNFGIWIIFAGMIFPPLRGLVYLGLTLFGAAVLFSLVTLPVEWNASSRAKHALTQAGIVSDRERAAAARVLNAAFLTYLAAAVSAVMTLLYYLLRTGVLGGDE